MLDTFAGSCSAQCDDMTFHRTLILTSCTLSLLLAAACDPGDKASDTNADETGGDDDGNGDGDEEQPGLGSNCGEEVVSIVEDLSAALPGFGGSVDDYLGLVEGSFAGEFSWLPNDGFLSIEHAGTSSALTMSVSYEGGEVRLTEVELVGQPPQGGELAGECSNVLEVDMTLDFATADGLFAEALQVPIRIYSDAEHARPGFYFSLDLAGLQGQLALDDFTVDQGSVSDLVLIGDFDGDAVEGSLNVEILSMDWVGFGAVAGFEAARVP